MWKYNSKFDMKEVGYDAMDLVYLAQGRDRWLALVNTLASFIALVMDAM
jgi:hypothetical protein